MWFALYDKFTPTDYTRNSHVSLRAKLSVCPSVCQLNRSVELQGGRSSQEENHHAINMVLTMIIAFFVCWLPYTALSVVVVLDPELYIPPLLATMPMYFAKTSPIYNPIIYFMTNKQVSKLQGIGSLFISAFFSFFGYVKAFCLVVAPNNSSVTPHWSCCPVAATYPTLARVSPSRCAPSAATAAVVVVAAAVAAAAVGSCPWAGTHTPRCCLCDSSQMHKMKPADPLFSSVAPEKKKERWKKWRAQKSRLVNSFAIAPINALTLFTFFIWSWFKYDQIALCCMYIFCGGISFLQQ